MIDIGLAMIFLTWDMFKKLRKMALRIVFLLKKFKNYVSKSDSNQEEPDLRVPSESVFATESEMQTNENNRNVPLSESKLGLIQADRDEENKEIMENERD